MDYVLSLKSAKIKVKKENNFVLESNFEEKDLASVRTPPGGHFTWELL